MFLTMGFVHIVASLALCLVGSDEVIIWSQFIYGLLEFSIGAYFYIEHEEVV